MLVIVLIAVAIILRLCAGISYLRATLAGRVSPSPVSWFFWAIIPLIAFAAQINQRVGVQAFATLALGVCPMVIFLVAAKTGIRSFKFTVVDMVSALFATAGIVLWLITSNAILALAFSILGDAFSGIPTIVKSYKDPDSEHAFPYLLSMISMLVTLATITNWNVARWAFPAYIFLTNSVFFTLIYSRVGLRANQRTSLESSSAL